MSDSEPQPLAQASDLSGTNTQPTAPAAPPTAGQMLGNARRLVGLSLEVLSSRVKVPVSRLQALEADRFEDWPDINVVRAVTASVCRHVRLDADIVLAHLPKAEKKVWSAAVGDSPMGFLDKDGFTLRSSGGLWRLPLALLAMALMLAAASLYFGPAVQAWVEQSWARQQLSAATSAPAAVPELVLPPDAGPTDTRVGAVAPETQVSMSAAAVAIPVPATTAPLAGASAATSGAGATAAAQQAAASKAMVGPSVAGTLASPAASPLLVFKARGLTWVAVTDAKGVSLLRKTLAAGETATASAASGALPLWVVVGRSDNTDVEVRGQPLKLEPSAADNVARFKVQ